MRLNDIYSTLNAGVLRKIDGPIEFTAATVDLHEYPLRKEIAHGVTP